MDSYSFKPHPFALQILKKLLTNKGVRFNDLLIDNLPSEHMNYHLKKLISKNFVQKVKELYTLTDLGKDYVSRLDDNKEIIEKQPKVSVILLVRRKNGNNETEFLLCKRLIQPYLGKVGRLTGKIQFGETIKQCALRELYEETGLNANDSDCTITQVYHKLRYNNDKEPIQDNIFFICSISDVKGTLITTTPVQENFWITKKDFDTQNIDKFDGLTLSEVEDTNKPWLNENSGIAVGY